MATVAGTAEMKLNVKIWVKVDGETFMEDNLTVEDAATVARLCDGIDGVIDELEGHEEGDPLILERVEPPFRADK